MNPRNIARLGGIALTSALLAGVAAPAFAGSFYLQEQSTRGLGRANSGEGADKGVQSLWWNPAAIAGTQRELYVGAHGLILDSDVDNAGSTLTYLGTTTVPVSGDPHVHGVVESGIVPNFAVSTPIGDRFNVALAVQAPYNFTTKYEANDFARYDALTSELRSANIGLVAAMRVADWLDVGAGFDAQYVDAKLTSAMPNLSPLLPDGANALEGDGWDYGWNVGAQARLGKLDLGLSYRSEIEHELDGQVNISGLLGPLAAANVSTDGVASFNTPWFATLSARYHVNDKLTLNAQVNRIGWSEFDAIRVAYGTGGTAIVQDYEDVTTGAVGFDYQVDPTLTVRGGVAFDPTPTQDGRRTARIPDGDRLLFTAGLSKTVRPGLTLDGAVSYIDIDDSEIADVRDIYGNGAVVSTLSGLSSGYGVGFSVGANWAF